MKITLAKICLLALVFFNCTNQKMSSQKTMKFDKQGHRGCRGLMPENTVPAMIKALELDVTTLEMDAVITKDRLVVLSHEPFFNHEITTKPDGTFLNEAEEKSLNIFAMTYSEVVKYDVGIKPHPRFAEQQKIPAVKPLLSTVIDSAESYCRDHGKPLPFYNIETKTTAATDDIFHPKPELFVDLLMEVVKQKGIEGRVIIQSFDFRTLLYLHKRYPSIKTAMLIEDFDKRTVELQLSDLGFRPSIYSPHFSLATKETIAFCHRKKIDVIPWTVNEVGQMRRLIEAGVDGIITDYPDLFVTALKN
jgi:glycerophosphoryl diester phosphodiesterase